MNSLVQRLGAGSESRSEARLLRLSLVLLDAAVLTFAVTASGVLRIVLDDVLPVTSLAQDRHAIASVLVVAVLLLLFWMHGLYDLNHILTGTREYARIVHALTYGVVVILAASYFAGGGPLVSRSWVLLVWALGIASAVTGRFVARRIVRALRHRGVLRTRVVIIGASTLGLAIAEQLRGAKQEGLDVIGFLDEYLPLGQSLLGDLTVIGRPGDLLDRPAVELADEYILVPQALPHERIEEISRLMGMGAAGPVLRTAVNSRDLLTHGVQLGERGGVPLVTLGRARITGLEAALKRGFDVIGATLLLLLLATPVVIALLRSHLRGLRPLLGEYQIYGTGARKIRLWLFEPGVSTSLPIRGAPALLAVLRGQLSLVGPRPTIWTTTADAPPALWLTSVKPGLTGPWRLSGPGATLSDQAVRDLAYVRNYTIWEDIRILCASMTRVPGDGRVPLLGRWQEPRVFDEPTGFLRSQTATS